MQAAGCLKVNGLQGGCAARRSVVSPAQPGVERR
jgi:hypothetical protein